MKEIFREGGVDFIQIIVSREEVEEQNIQPLNDTLKTLLEDKYTTMRFKSKVEINFDGYNDDSRELWEIEEVRSFVKAIDKVFPYWFFFLFKQEETLKGQGLSVIAKSLTNTIKLTATKVWLEPYSSASFFNKHFAAMFEICDRINLPKDEDEALILEVGRYFSRVIDYQTLYQQAIIFAGNKHSENDQKIPGTNLPYVVHLSNVAMEILIASSNTPDFNLRFAIQIALLHDTIEDTSTTFDELAEEFGLEVANAVSALTKNEELPYEERMNDCLVRIKKLKKEVWAVKLADRITNLQPPPSHWDIEKRRNYQQEAKVILNELRDGNNYLALRLESKIKEYANYINE